MYCLYSAPGAGSIAPEVMFEEAGIRYRTVPINLAAGEHLEADYLAINPAGQVPALRLPDGSLMTESAAMVLLIGERHPEAGLVPGNDQPERPTFLRWLLFMATAVYPAMLRINHTERFTTDADGMPAVREAALSSLVNQFTLLDQAVAGDPWFLASGYSALDIYLAMLADWHPQPKELLAECRSVARLCEATEQRPAFARVMARHRGSG